MNTGSDALTMKDRVGSWQWPLLSAVTLLGIYVWVFWDFVWRQLRWAWREQADWGHTVVIPLIAAWFVYQDRRRLLATPFKTTWSGLVLVVAGVALYSICALTEAVRHHNLLGFSAWLTLVGMVLLFTGYRAMRYLWFPLVYILVFGQTISERLMSLVTYKLQDIAAVGSYYVLQIIGLDVERSGNVLNIFDSDGNSHGLNIAEACSGMRMLMAFLALGVALAYTGLPRLWQRATLVILAVPTALSVNVLRVVTLGVLSLFDTNFAAGDFHSFIGLIWLVPALVIFLVIMWVVRNLVVEDETSIEGATS